MTVAVVVPLYGSPDTVEPLVARVRAVAPDALLVLVDDACPLGSGDAARRAAASRTDVLVLAHEENRGQQEAIMSGLRATRADEWVVLDADLQDRPEAIPLLLERLRSGRLGAVFAGRRGHYESLGRRVAGIGHRAVLSVALGLPWDAGGYVAMSAACVEEVLSLDGPPQLVAMIGRTGLPTTSVPVRRDPRPAGTSAIDGAARVRHAMDGLHHARHRWVAGEPHERSDT